VIRFRLASSNVQDERWIAETRTHEDIPFARVVAVFADLGPNESHGVPTGNSYPVKVGRRILARHARGFGSNHSPGTNEPPSHQSCLR